MMADDIIKNIKTEVEEIDCSVNPEFIQLDFNIDDPPEITDQPLHLSHTTTTTIPPNTTTTLGNFKCLSCNLILPSKLEYDVHQQIHHSSPPPQNRRSSKTSISYDECYDPESEDVDDPNYTPPSRSRNYKNSNITPKPKAVQAVHPLINSPPIIPSLPKPSVSIINSEKNYKCSKCFYLTENESLIREHMAKNKHAFKYQCNYCTKSFQFVYMLNNHHKSHHKDDEPCFDEFTTPIPKENDVFVCSLCPQSEKNPNDIEKHHRQVHGHSSRPFSYYIENIISKSSKPALLGSKVVHQSKTDFQEKSDARYVRTNDYAYSGRPGRRPRFAVHSDSMSSKSDVNELFYNCIACDTWFKTLIECKTHQERCHPGENLALYVSTNEGGPKLQEKSLTKYICIRCSDEAFTTSEIKMHCRIHKNASQPLQYIQLMPNEDPKFIEEATYKCSQCDVIPDTLMNMQKHWSDMHPNKVFKVMKLYADSPEKSFICKVCAKIFKHSLMLDLHVRVKHSSEVENGAVPKSLTETPFSRSQSPCRNLNSNLTNMAPSQVLKPPSDTRPPLKPNHAIDTPGKIIIEKYQCLYCSQSYTFFDKLKEHHVGEHADFTWLYLYVRHMDNGSVDVISSGDKLYRCFYCNSEFGKNFSLLSIHYKDIHAPLQFKYKICEGKDGFTNWVVREQELKMSDTKENRKIATDEPTIPNPEKNSKPDIPQLYVIPPQHQKEQVADDEILPDIKPDVNYLNSLIDKSRDDQKDPKRKKLEEAYASVKKLKLEDNYISWYCQKPEKIDLNRIVLLREFNNSTFKIAVSNISTVMNLQPKVMLQDYYENKDK